MAKFDIDEDVVERVKVWLSEMEAAKVEAGQQRGLMSKSVIAGTFIRVHIFNSLLDNESTNTEILRFNQEIFGQDKPIVENQRPKLLPLDPRVETPIRADKLAVAYRRRLSELGVTYGVTYGVIPTRTLVGSV